MQQPKFGKAPDKVQRKSFESSPYYKNGQFQNLNSTPQFTDGNTFWSVFFKFLVERIQDRVPTQPIPFIKTNLKTLPLKDPVLIWFGHSSYFLQLQSLKILVDPVFSGNASPLSGTMKAFNGADEYGVEDLPFLDILLITHDHYDHLDYNTILKLKNKVGRVICSTGVGAHLIHWGYDPNLITEMGWGDHLKLDLDLDIFCEPARHFSGRTFLRNRSHWSSFVLKSPELRLFLGGDSGYDTHFADIGLRHGPFDIAILENGQYNKAWRHLHAFPADVLQAGDDLRAKAILPVHSGKFAMSNHPWKEPLDTISKLHKGFSFRMITPQIGEIVELSNSNQVFEQWWKNIQ